MQKQKILLIIGIVLGIAVVFLVKVYLEKQREAAEDEAAQRFAQLQQSQASVLVARKDIPKGAAIDPKDLEAKIFPNEFIQPGAVTSADRIAGMITLAPIATNEQIILSKLTQPHSSSTNLSSLTPAGKRAITITVDNIASLVGMIKPGDYVDVIVTLPMQGQTGAGQQGNQAIVVPMFQNILILAVGQNIGGPAESSRAARQGQEASPLITLALSPQEANLISFVQEHGKIRLVLRSPTDVQVEPKQLVTWDTLTQYLMPQQAGPKEDQAASYVEIYRGLNRERVPLAK